MNMLKLLKIALNKKIIDPIDFYFGNFVSQKNNVLMLIATCLSYETRNGHIFLSIEYFKKNCFFSIFDLKLLKNHLIILIKNVDWKKEIIEHTAISDGSILTPLVFFKKKIYLYKIWKAEDNILKNLQKKYTPKINKKKCFNILDNLFFSRKDSSQKIAIILTLINKITFIIGRPGTGKTTTILKIIIALIKNSKKTIKIQLSAPTGKATNHLNNIIKNDIFDIYLSETEKKSLPNQALTIHKLLKIEKISQKNNNFLDIDVLIIDESSMIDILLMERIFCSVSENTKLIFIGDHNQLPPVENGFIFKNICYHAKYGYSSKTLTYIEKLIKKIYLKKYNNKKSNFISDKICVLKKNYRFNKNSGIYILSNAIYRKNKKTIIEFFNNSINNVFFHEVNSITQYNNMIEYISLGYKTFWEKIHKQEKVEEVIKVFQSCQVLCVLNESMFGVNILNQKLEERIHEQYMTKLFFIHKKKWYIGKPIIVTRNNQSLGLFNGNIGITNINENGILQVSFLKENKQILNLPVNILKDYDTAWTMTVHKAQGSEFINTILILPNFNSKILNKDILYTAVTRSKKKLDIFSTKKIFLNTILNNTNKKNSLINRI